MRRAFMVVVLFVVSVSAAMALSEADLMEVTAKLVEASGRQDFRVSVDSSQELNACAYPDGRILVTQGMLLALDRHDELAFVLGHEMTHVICKHGAGQVKRAWTGILVGALIGLVSQKYLHTGKSSAETGAQIGGALFVAQRSQKDEFSADTGGLNLAYKAGYNPDGGIDAMKLLQSRYGNGQAGIPVLGWLASHPDTGARVRNLEKVAATLPARAPEPVLAPAAPVAAPETPIALQETTEPVQSQPTPPVVTPVEPPASEPKVEQAPVIEAPVVETPLGPNELRLYADRAWVFCPDVPSSAAKVNFRFLDEHGTEMCSFDSARAPFRIGMMGKDLAGHGKVTMQFVAFDSTGAELARGQKYLVIQ